MRRGSLYKGKFNLLDWYGLLFLVWSLVFAMVVIDMVFMGWKVCSAIDKM